eukprot:1157065-Pelagomonas_calceolata.AAC.3
MGLMFLCFEPHALQVHVEEEVARGEAVGAVWTITGGQHDTTALCVRDSELVRMSKSAFKVSFFFGTTAIQGVVPAHVLCMTSALFLVA